MSGFRPPRVQLDLALLDALRDPLVKVRNQCLYSQILGHDVYLIDSKWKLLL